MEIMIDLAGKTIKEIRYYTEEEKQNLSPEYLDLPIIELTDGTLISTYRNEDKNLSGGLLIIKNDDFCIIDRDFS